MDNDNYLVITDNFEPESLLGKIIKIEEQEFELVSILGIGHEKIVYELKDLQTGKTDEWVIKVFRERKGNDDLLHWQNTFKTIRDVLGRDVGDTKHFFVGDWLVEFQRRYILVLHAGILNFWKQLTEEDAEVKRIAELYNNGELENALRECEAKLELFPLKPDYLAIQAVCLLALDRDSEALGLIELCLEVDPGEARHHQNFAVALLNKGLISLGRDSAHKAVRLASRNDKPAMLEFLFKINLALGQIDDASTCLEDLKKLGSSKTLSKQLNVLEEKLRATASKFTQIEQKMKNAWYLYEQDNLESALQLIHWIEGEAPYYRENPMFLRGMIALRKKQWFEAGRALVSARFAALEDLQEIQFYLGFVLFMRNGPEASYSDHTEWINTAKETISKFDKVKGVKSTLNIKDILFLSRGIWYIKVQCIAIHAIYSSLPISDTILKNKRAKMIRDSELLEEAIDTHIPSYSSLLSDHALKRHKAPRYQQDPDLLDLVKILDSLPLAREVVLTKLAQQIPTPFFTALQAGNRTREALRQFPEAYEALNRATSLEPGYGEVGSAKGGLLFAQGRFARAQQAYERVLEIVPRYPPVLLSRAMALSAQGHYDAALHDIDEAIGEDPNWLSAYRLKGETLISLKRYDEAVLAYEQVLASDHKDTSAWFDKASALRLAGQIEESLVAFQQVIVLEPFFASAWVNVALILRDIHAYEDALKAFKQAISIQPDLVDAWTEMGKMLFDIGAFRQALDALEQALALDSKNISLLIRMGVALAHLGREERALATLDRALALDPQNIFVMVNKSAVLDQFHHNQEALILIEQVLALNPEEVTAWINKGNALGSLGRNEEALVAFERALSLDPDSLLARFNKAFSLERLHRYQEALALYDNLNTPGDPDYWEARARVLFKLGRPREAEDAVHQFRKLRQQGNRRLKAKD